MPEIRAGRMAAIGCTGGFALSLLKLIEAKFFVEAPLAGHAIGAYLTYASFVLLGGLAAAFLADHELPYEKLRRSAFIIGLGAPSILFALAHQSVKPPEPVQLPSVTIPSLTWLPLPAALAQQQREGASTSGSPAAPPVFVLKRDQVTPSVADGFAAAWGRGSVQPQYAFVLGRTTSLEKANKTALGLGELLVAEPGGTDALKPRVVKLEGSTEYIVLIGGFASKDALYRVKAASQGAAIESLTGGNPTKVLSEAEKKRFAELINNGSVVPASAIFSIK